jgi:hypothetical protein
MACNATDKPVEGGRCCIFCGAAEKINISNISLEKENDKLKHENLLLKDQIKNMEEEIEKLKKYEDDIKKYKKANCELFKSNVRLLERLKDAFKKGKDEAHKEVQDLLSNVFSPGQIRRLFGAKRVVWDAEDISSAMALHIAGSKAYQFLRLKMHFPLPCVSVLRKWARKIPCKPGVQNEVLDLMSKKAHLCKPHELLLVATFDEVMVSQKYCYDKGLDQVQGPHKNAQVMMVRPLFSQWKQPVYYDFDKSMTKGIYMDIVSKLYESGYTVIATTCDMGATNRAFWKSLGVSSDNVSIPHPNDPKANIYFFADTPHVLKLLRNHFHDSGFNLDGHHLSKEILVKTLEILREKKSEVRLGHKLQESQLHVSTRGRQRVRPAAQFYSRTNATAIRWCNHWSADPTWTKCADFFDLVNKWFDVLNVRSKQWNMLPCQQGYGLQLEKQNEVLKEMKDTMLRMRVEGHQSMLPFQKGVVMNCTALPQLYEEITTKFPNISYLLTYRLNQDLLENLFASIRAAGITYSAPLPTEFKYRLRRYILSKNPQAFTSNKNCIPDDTQNLNIIESLNQKKTQETKKTKSTENSVCEAFTSDTIYETESASNEDQIELEQTEYLTSSVDGPVEKDDELEMLNVKEQDENF